MKCVGGHENTEEEVLKTRYLTHTTIDIFKESKDVRY